MAKNDSTSKKRITKLLLEFLLLILVSSIFFIVIYSAMQEGNHKRRIIVPEALDAPYQPYRSTESRINKGMVTPMDSMMRDVYVVQREINQGSHQLYLFFDTFTHRPAPLDLKHIDLKDPKDAQWYNFAVYFIMLLLVALPTITAFIAKYFFNKQTEEKKEKRKMKLINGILNFTRRNRIMIVIIVFMIAVLLSMVNLSIPLDKEFEYRADPFFVFVCFSSFAVAIVSLKYVLKGLKRIKYGYENSLTSKSIFRNTLFWGALGTWAMGFLCYFIGMYSLGTQKSVLASIVRPALESGKMFVLSDNIKEISFTLRNNGAFMGFYTICKLAFLLISSFALVSIAWSRIVSFSSIWEHSREPGDLYVFFGINENSKILAHDVAQRLREEQKIKEERKKKEDKKLSRKERRQKRKEEKKLNKDNKKKKNVSKREWTIVMVENRNNPVEGMGNGMTISSLVGMFNFRKDAYAETREIDNKALLVISDSTIGSRECSEQINEVDKMEDPDKETKYDLFNSLGLKSLSKMIKSANKNENKCHFFFLDEDARSNIDASDNLKRMLSIVHPSDTEKTIYCLARNNAFSSQLERSASNKGNSSRIKVKILDMSVMAAQSLFLTPENHPINFVHRDTSTATVKSRFESLVLGFGRGGRDIVRYLYEFGAFLDHDSAIQDNGKTIRSPFQCTVIDKDINVIEPRYMAKLSVAKAACNHGDFKDPLLRFENAALNSQRFVSLIKEKLQNPDMNYVVISLGNDKTNMGALTFVVDMAMRIRKGKLGKLRIFVRNYDPIYKDTMQDQAENYNRMLCSERMYDKTMDDKPVVTIFGRRSELLTHQMIVKDQTIDSAKRFHKAYIDLKEDNKDCKGKNRNELWDIRHNPEDDNKNHATHCIQWVQKSHILRQETQDIHNGIHFDTKLRLIGFNRQIHLEEQIKKQINDDIQIKQLIQGQFQKLVQLQKPTGILKQLFVWNAEKKKEQTVEQELNQMLNDLEEKAKDNILFKNEKLIARVRKWRSQMTSPDNEKIFLNLARNEHIRWTASLEMLGYKGIQPDTEPDCYETAKEHPGLVDWNKLDENQHAVVKLLVKSSFKLADSILKQQKELFEQARKDALKNILNNTREKALKEALDIAKEKKPWNRFKKWLKKIKPQKTDNNLKSEVAEEPGTDQQAETDA